ncbi:MAG TPA: class I SAM-dependent methyltransferase [Reyranellaceae bacterium]|nr:class I SAM-dependent methyltransferase [Reyranellaceae bacterium]
MARASGTEGYGETADELVERYEALEFEHVHRSVLPFLSPPPASVIDIGAGTGRDAAAFAARGYRVVAVEPTPELRAHAQRLHADVAIEWIDDALPDLTVVRGRRESFGLVMLTAVWMHLDLEQRGRAMPAVASLMAPNGIMSALLRHGPVPRGRRMFEVSAAETVALAARHGLSTVHNSSRAAVTEAKGVTWDVLVFTRPA